MQTQFNSFPKILPNEILVTIVDKLHNNKDLCALALASKKCSRIVAAVFAQRVPKANKLINKFTSCIEGGSPLQKKQEEKLFRDIATQMSLQELDEMNEGSFDKTLVTNIFSLIKKNLSEKNSANTLTRTRNRFTKGVGG